MRADRGAMLRRMGRGLLPLRGLLAAGAPAALWIGAAPYLAGPGHGRSEELAIAALLLHLPGLALALRLREAWPALGPGDSALPHALGQLPGRRILDRLLLLALALPALLLLHLLLGLGIGFGTRGLPDGAGPFLGSEIAPPLQASTLRRRGDRLRLRVPAGVREIRVQPQAFLGNPAEVELLLEDRGGRTLSRASWKTPGAFVRLPLPAPLPRPSDLVIERGGGPGPVLDFGEARIRGVRARLPSWTTGLCLAADLLPWALLLLLSAFGLAPFLSPGPWILATAGAAPLLASLLDRRSRELLERGLWLPPPPERLLPWGGLALLLIVLGFRPPRPSEAG